MERFSVEFKYGEWCSLWELVHVQYILLIALFLTWNENCQNKNASSSVMALHDLMFQLIEALCTILNFIVGTK